MPKSGPKELAAYHALQLEKERGTMSSTSFDTEKLDDEALAEANARIAKMPNLQVKPIESQPTLTAPHGNPNPPASPKPAAAPPEEKRTRTTVAKLLVRYQERHNEALAVLGKINDEIEGLKVERIKAASECVVWAQAIAEIEKD